MMNAGFSLANTGKGEFGLSFGRLTSNVNSPTRPKHSLLLSTVPNYEARIKSGIVERRTVHANVIWRRREMILTKDSILFSRPDSNVVVDQISIEDIISVGKVDNLDAKPGKNVNPKHLAAKESNTSANRSQRLAQRRRSSIVKTESIELLQEYLRQTHAFEIKTGAGTQFRSYFVRVDSIGDCDDWIEKIKHSISAVKSENASRNSWLEVWQQKVRDFYDDHRVRYVIAAAILLDFFSSVFESEFIQITDGPVLSLFNAVDILLCVFFSLELVVNLFGHWRTAYGTPFVQRVSSWFLLATVLFQLSGFFLPKLDAQHLKVRQQVDTRNWKIICANIRWRGYNTENLNRL